MRIDSVRTFTSRSRAGLIPTCKNYLIYHFLMRDNNGTKASSILSVKSLLALPSK